MYLRPFIIKPVFRLCLQRGAALLALRFQIREWEAGASFLGQKSSSLKVGQPERTKLGLLVLLKLVENGELFRVVLLWQVSFREGCRGGDRGTAEGEMGGHHKLL